MDDFKEIFFLFRSIYESIYHKEMELSDFIEIFSKIKIINKRCSIGGLEILELVDLLLEFKKNNVLDRINRETIEMVSNLYFFQIMTAKTEILSRTDIIRNLLCPYNLNKCEKEEETYIRMFKFENTYNLIGNYISSIGVNYLETVRKFNNELYKLMLYTSKNISKMDEKESNNVLLCTSLARLFSLFYFKQNEYENDYELLDSIASNIIENSDSFIDYCNNEGIKLLLLSIKDCQNTYRGLIRILDEGYRNKRIKRK